MTSQNQSKQDARSPIWMSEIAIGCSIFFVPFFTYLSPVNLRQLSSSDIIEIFISMLFVLVAIAALSFFAKALVRKTIGKEIPALFPLLCFVFYLQFSYNPYSSYLQEFFAPMFGVVGIYVILSFILLCLLIIGIGMVFNALFKRFVFIYAALMLLSAFIPLSEYIFSNYGNETSEKINRSDENNTIISSVSEKRNIYYVLLDGMMAIDAASQEGLVNGEETRERIAKTGLKYIDQSLSSYSNTYLTIASIMNVDYHQTPNAPKYKNRRNFFPSMMRPQASVIPLASYLEQANSTFYWAGNDWGACRVSAHWTCINAVSGLSTKSWFRTLSGLSTKPWFHFYQLTPFVSIHQRLFNERNQGQHTINKFLKYLAKNEKPKDPFFVFIHNLSPHAPYLVSKNCEPANYSHESFNGYQASYLCALRKIESFIKTINAIDPHAIVIFQADHGNDDLGKKFNEQESILLRGKIFNAIKAPQSCLDKYGEPKTNVNTIRFALNCSYGFNFPYRDDVHYKGFYENEPAYGSVIEKRIY